MSRAYVGLAFLVPLLSVTASGCQRDLPSEPQSGVAPVGNSPLKVLPTNGGLVPSPIISSNPNSTETIRFEFTFDDSIHNKEIEGQPYGVWFGEGDSVVTNPPTGNVAFRVYHSWGLIYNLPSPPHYAAQPASIRQSFLYFDPPVRQVSFSYASREGDGYSGSPFDAFYYRVTSTTGSTLKLDTIHANNMYPGDYANWDTLTVYSANDDVIDHIFFNGTMVIDDLEIVRAASPALDCGGAVTRGDNAICTVLKQVDSVAAWHFQGQISGGPPIQIDTVLTTTQWSGRAVASGLVSAEVFISDSLYTFEDSLIVQPRSLGTTPWTWDDSKWTYTPEGGQPCFNYAPYYFPAADTIAVAENSSTEDCEIQTFTPRSNNISIFQLTYAEDSVSNGGPNQGLHFVAQAYYEMDHGSYYNPSVRPDTAGSAVTSADNLKDCHAGKNVSSLSKNLHEFNIDCTKTPERNEFLSWWAAVENHEGYGTPGMGPDDNGHQAQREIAAGLPGNNPYALAEPAIGNTSFQLKALLGTLVFGADEAIADSSASHTNVKGNWGTFDPVKGRYCGNIYAYWTDQTPAEYVRTYVCEKG